MVFTRDDVNSMAFSTFMRDYTPFGEYVDGDKRYQFNDLDFMLFKMEDALEPLNSLAMNNFDKDYSHIQAAKDNLLMLFDDYYKIAEEHPSYKDSEQLFMTLLDDCLKESIANCDNDSDVRSVITKAYVIEDFKREQFTRCSQEEMADNLYNSLSDFVQDKDAYLDLASIEGLFPEDMFKKLRDKNKDPYSYYEYQMSGALDEDYTTPQSDKSDHFKLEYYLDGLRSIVGNGDFSQQNLYCVNNRLTNEFNIIAKNIVDHKDKNDLSDYYLYLSEAMDETFVSNADKLKSIDPDLLRGWFESCLSQIRGDVVGVGFEGNGKLSEKDAGTLMFGILCERYYDENFAKFGLPNLVQGEKHYQPHIMTAFLNSKTVSNDEKKVYYEKYRDAVCVDDVYELDKNVGHKCWERSFTKFMWSNDSFSEYKSDYGVDETDLENRRFLEDVAYAKGRGLTDNLLKNITDSLNDINGSFDMVESNIANTVKFGKDFLANMNAVSGIVGNGIRKAFREAGGNQSYAQTINSAIQDTKGINFLSLDSMPYGSLNPRSYVKNCATAHIIYESVWASMNGEPVQTMRDLARDVCVYVDDNARGVLNGKDVRDIVHRFCSDVSGVNAFDDVAEKAHYYSHLDFVNDGKIKETFGLVRKRLNVPYEEYGDSNDFDFGSSK